MNVDTLSVDDWNAMSGYEQWQAFQTTRGSKLTVMATLASKTVECGNLKDTLRKQSVVIHNQIVSMQRKDIEITRLTECLDKEIHKKKSRDRRIWAKARAKQCKARGHELAMRGKEAVEAVDGAMSIIKHRSMYRKEKEQDDKHGGLKSPQDRIWVRQHFVEKVLELEGGELTEHDLAVIWPACPTPNQKTKHRQPLTKKEQLPPTEEEEDGDLILMASRKRAYEEDQEWSEDEDD